MIKNIILSLLLLIVLVGCQQPKKQNDKEVQKVDQPQEVPPVITYDEYSGKEPTTPEETEFYKPVVPEVQPFAQNGTPSDAVILFDGSNLDQWVSSADSTAAKWILNKDGSMTVKNRAGDIQTKKNFGSFQLHIEWKSPEEIQGEGQSRANSGIFLQNRYEVQVLDNNDNPTYTNGQVGTIYKQGTTLAMASVPTGKWNTYDIIYHAPEFNKLGGKIKSATVTILQNGVLIQDHTEIKGTTPYIGWPKNEAHGEAPIRLQDHGDNSRVSYRNIWVRPLD